MRTEESQVIDRLMVAVAGGDRVAFSELYDSLADRVFGLSMSVLRSTEHAREVSQEVFLHIWTNAAGFDPARGTAVSWVLTMTRGRSIDRVRAQESSNRRERRDASMSVRDVQDPVHEQVRIRMDGQQVRRQLSLLSPLQRQAIELAFFSGLSYPEVAQRLSAPLGTVKGRIRDGLRRMRAGLEVTV